MVSTSSRKTISRKTISLSSDTYQEQDSIHSSTTALREYPALTETSQANGLVPSHRFTLDNEVVAKKRIVNKPIVAERESITVDPVFANDSVSGKDTKNGVIGLVAAYNEARFIASVVISALRFAERVLVIDDGSHDDTALIARAAGADVIEMEANGGKGAAIQHGLDIILSLPDIRAIVLLDGDGQHDPMEIPEVVAPILDKSADLSIGSRFLDVESDIPVWRQVGQLGLTWFTNIASGTPLTDSQSGFRALSPTAAKQLKFQTSDFSMESEMQFTIHDLGLTAVEVPITCVYEEPPKRNPITHGLEVVAGIIRLVAHVRPLFFGTISAIAFWLMGAALSLDVFTAFNQTGNLPLASTLLTAGLLVVGSTAFICGIMLQSVRDLMKAYLVQKVDI